MMHMNGRALERFKDRDAEGRKIRQKERGCEKESEMQKQLKHEEKRGRQEEKRDRERKRTKKDREARN